MKDLLVKLGLLDRDYVSYEEFRNKAETKAMMSKLNRVRKKRVEK